MTVRLRKADKSQNCDVIRETLVDGIHDEVCSLPAESVVTDGINEIAFCSTHSKDVLSYVNRKYSVPKFFGRRHIGKVPEDRVNIKGDNSIGRECDCPDCKES